LLVDQRVTAPAHLEHPAAGRVLYHVDPVVRIVAHGEDAILRRSDLSRLATIGLGFGTLQIDDDPRLTGVTEGELCRTGQAFPRAGLDASAVDEGAVLAAEIL
jgi:hypothetical protein